MTEDEAKTKWCPHAVASHTDPRAMAHHERPQLGLPTETFRHACIGSACMAWRWKRHPESAAVKMGHGDATGYCGLAGSPDR